MELARSDRAVRPDPPEAVRCDIAMRARIGAHHFGKRKPDVAEVRRDRLAWFTRRNKRTAFFCIAGFVFAAFLSVDVRELTGCERNVRFKAHYRVKFPAIPHPETLIFCHGSLLGEPDPRILVTYMSFGLPLGTVTYANEREWQHETPRFRLVRLQWQRLTALFGAPSYAAAG